MISQLIYVSVRKPNCDQKEINKILEACKRNNKGIDVTGVLLYSDTHFVQYLEGKYSTIMELYDKIKSDDRHKNIVLLSTTPIGERIFPSWEMGSKKFKEDDVEFNTDMSSEEKVKFQLLLEGKEGAGSNSLELIKKFFK